MLAPASFSARTLFITGAGPGLGRGFPLRAAELGARVALAGRRENLLRRLPVQSRRKAANRWSARLDIRKPDAVEVAIERVVRKPAASMFS